MTIWHGMIKVVEVKKFNKDMAVADKDNLDKDNLDKDNLDKDNLDKDNSTQDSNTQDNSIQDNNKTATTSSGLQLKVV